MADTLEAALSGLQLSTELAKQISYRVYVKSEKVKQLIQQFLTMPFPNKVWRQTKVSLYAGYEVVLLWPEQVNKGFWDADYNFDSPWTRGERDSIYNVSSLPDKLPKNPSLYMKVRIVHRPNDPHITIYIISPRF